MAEDVVALNESVTQQLECPVCFLQMMPPIEMCKNGHNLCSDCKPKMRECPLCKGELTNVRNRTLEDIAESYLHPCVNMKFGCTITIKQANMETHIKECQFKPDICLAFKDDGCSWEGRPSEIYDHIKTSHNNCMVYENFPVNLHFFMNLAVKGIRLAKVKDDLFWVHLRQDPTKSKFFRAVQYTGDPEKASKYEYSFELALEDTLGTIVTYRRKVYKKNDNIEEEFEKNDTLAHFFDFIKKTGYNKNSVVYTFNIHEVEQGDSREE